LRRSSPSAGLCFVLSKILFVCGVHHLPPGFWSAVAFHCWRSSPSAQGKAFGFCFVLWRSSPSAGPFIVPQQHFVCGVPHLPLVISGIVSLHCLPLIEQCFGLRRSSPSTGLWSTVAFCLRRSSPSAGHQRHSFASAFIAFRWVGVHRPTPSGISISSASCLRCTQLTSSAFARESGNCGISNYRPSLVRVESGSMPFTRESVILRRYLSPSAAPAKTSS